MDNRWTLYVIVIGVHFAEMMAFNVDLEFPILLRGTEETSYFGYSVALHRNRNGPMALVTAPRANSIYETTSREPGVLFTCPISNFNSTCEEVNLGIGNEQKNHVHQYNHLRDNMWLGVSLDVQQGSKENNVVICGHLWKNQYHAKNYFLNGICYVINQDLDKESLKTLLPFVNKAKQIINHNGTDYSMFAFGQAGFSAAFSETGKHLLLGAPGYTDWIGTAVNYDAPDFAVPVIPFQKHKPPYYSYIGYSITSGKFFADDDHYIALGAPRGGNDHGQVYIIEALSERNKLFKVRQEKEGKWPGEYFGSAVMAINLNNDNYTDLLVGAPLSSTSSYGDVGKVYVFIGSEKELQDFAELNGENKPFARFGTSIAHVGDLNQDGFNDVAIGAPYEEDQSGAIYIYHGTNAGIDDHYKQKIRAQDVQRGLQGFGISISRGLDIDSNHYPDILVGSYASGNAVLFRTRPVIQVTAKIEVNPQQINTNATGVSDEQMSSINITSCLKYSGNHIRKELDFLVGLSMDSNRGENARRGYFMVKNQKSFKTERNTSLSKDIETCFEDQAYVYADTKDVINPIPFLLKIELQDGASEDVGFCKTCPVLDPRYSSSYVKFVPFLKNCGEDEICEADLVVDAHIIETPSNSPVIIGEKTSLTLDINVTNLMESAYSSELFVLLPSETSVINQDFCIILNEEEKQKANATLKCELGNPLNTNDSVHVKIKIDISKLPISMQTMDIYVASNTTSIEINQVNNKCNVSVAFKTVADIEISGVAEREQILYSLLDDDNDASVPISHTYFVMNHGPSPLQYINIGLHIPNIAYGKSGAIGFLNLTDLEVSSDESFASLPACYYTSMNPRGVGFKLMEAENSESGKCNSNARSGNNASFSKTKLYPENYTIETTDSSNLAYTSSYVRKGESKTNTFTKESKLLSINCETTSCVAIHCCLNPSADKRRHAKIKIKGKINITAIEKLSLRPWSRIEFSTHGKIYVTGENVEIVSQSKSVHEISIKTFICHHHLPPAEVATWIIFLSAGIGILLLFLIVIILIKFGFFKRQRERMMMSAVVMKEETANELAVDEMKENDFFSGHTNHAINHT